MSRRRRRSKPSERRITQPVARIPMPGQQPTVPTYEHRRPGRPGLLTRENRDRFLMAIRAGATREPAAIMCGLSPRTVDEWILRGRGKHHSRPAMPEHIEFVRLLEEAEAQAEVVQSGYLYNRGRVDHNASLAWLRSRHPERWPRFPGGDEEEEYPPGRPAPAQGTVEVHTVERNVVFLPLDAFDQVTHQLLEQKRAERRELEAATPEPDPEPEPKVIADDSRTRRTGLRVEAADTTTP